MKKLIICLMLMTAVVFAQDQEDPCQELREQNELLKSVVLDQYLALSEMELKDAFVDLYLYSLRQEVEGRKMSESVELANNFIDDVKNVKSMEELRAVLKKYGIKKDE